MDAIRAARVRIGVDPLGGAAVHYWDPVVDRYGIDLRVVNRSVDPTFRFMAVDWDGKVRMDCSSPQAMAGLIAMRGAFDVAFGNDTDADRHGIVCPSSGLMAPNQFLSAALAYLCGHRPNWRSSSAIGKTVVSSGMIDRVASQFGRTLFETPVGFKWFGAGLDDGSICFAGEESAGASFLRRDGSVWTTDKDGLIMGLLAGEIVARTGQDPLRFYEASTSGLGRSFYERVDAPASGALRTRLASLSEDDFDLETLGAEPIEQKLILAPGNGAPIGGIKVTAKGGWLAIRPSGTEDIYKMYAESFLSEGDLQQILSDGQKAVGDLLESA
jgi:phosphoglucomutase